MLELFRGSSMDIGNNKNYKVITKPVESKPSFNGRLIISVLSPDCIFLRDPIFNLFETENPLSLVGWSSLSFSRNFLPLYISLSELVSQFASQIPPKPIIISSTTSWRSTVRSSCIWQSRIWILCPCFRSS